MRRLRVSRRALLQGAAAGALALALPSRLRALAPPALPAAASPFPLEAVRLLPSPFLDALEANRAYLHRLSADRLLHNYRRHAGLEPKAEPYGGWEADTIAGHSLGHYLTANALMFAATGDELCRERVHYIVAELEACQAAAGDGYVAGFTRRRGELIEDGRNIFPEIRRGEIQAAGFDLNGCWVPFYNWHKLFAGLFAAQRHCASAPALGVAVGLAGFIAGVLDALSEDQLQQVLDCEHGGINESFAELHALTGERRWLALAERIRHKKVLDPLVAGVDVLPNLHANTQIPKVIGLARLYELAGRGENAAAARFFWTKVVQEQSYVIGGNADREYFQAPHSISKHITEQTCESCNTYNMLKLTRHLFGWRPDASLFDFYERAHLNHILAQQDPATGAFAYMVPLLSGAAREWSSPEGDFWCCVGSGMESHAKHGDSIFWRAADGGALLVNLYVPARLDWAEKRLRLELRGAYPFAGPAELEVLEAGALEELTLFLRVPSWCAAPVLRLNGEIQPLRVAEGYLALRRAFTAGDRVELELPRAPRLEATPDDPQVVALLDGPLVLAADLGPATEPFGGGEPALVGQELLADLVAVPGRRSHYRAARIGRPGALAFEPFFAARGRRTAVYFRRYDEAGWRRHLTATAAEEEARRALDARAVDGVELGDEAAEKAHGLESKISYPVSYRWRKGRDARSGGYFEFRLRGAEGPLELQAVYWGEERRRHFHLLVDGERIASQKLDGETPGEWITRAYPVPEALSRGKSELRVRFEPEPGFTAGPVFGCRLLRRAARS